MDCFFFLGPRFLFGLDGAESTMSMSFVVCEFAPETGFVCLCCLCCGNAGGLCPNEMDGGIFSFDILSAKVSIMSRSAVNCSVLLEMRSLFFRSLSFLCSNVNVPV